ncbi:MAG TPA: M14 metallopeptidase family protein, partial [Pyrinomonadaceae bacterium]|nr:M14 metallopeptidase family protein [Pyrinomonadaceae bacterium]
MPCHSPATVREAVKSLSLRRPAWPYLILLLLVFSQTVARADDRLEIEGAHASVPSPASVLGFTPGDDRKIADWKQITNYFARLDRASSRVEVQTLGTTTLGRPLFVVFISAPENIRNLARLKEIQRRLADPRTVESEEERDSLIRQGKTVLAISCSIHSTEIVASQMSMQLAYELASAGDAKTREVLKNTLLILIPSPNPDGIDTVANWYRKTLGTAYEGTDPPELYHHYAGHDDNRDWFMMNLQETKLITRLFWKEWFPQIVYDVHQQGESGSRFFIPPFFEPSNPNISPLLLQQVDLAGQKIADELRVAGFKGVITNSNYDTWWHGGFRTAPYYHNSIGILSEAASARLMSPADVTREQLAKATSRGMPSALTATTNFPDPWPGGAWHPREIMNMELQASRTLMTLASEKRTEYLRNFYELGRSNVAVPPRGGPVAYLIPALQGNDEAVAKLVGLLVEQGIEVQKLEQELHGVLATQTLETVGGENRVETIAQSGEAEEIPAGSYIIFLNQPFRADVQSLFEIQVYPDRRNPQGEAERPYDVAGWTLPLQMGVKAPVVTRLRERSDEMRLRFVRDENEVRRDLGLSPRTGQASPVANPLTRPVRLGVYRGWVK